MLHDLHLTSLRRIPSRVETGRLCIAFQLEIAPYSPLAVVMRILVRRTAVGVFVGVNQVLLLVLVSFLWHHRRAAHQTAYIMNKVRGIVLFCRGNGCITLLISQLFESNSNLLPFCMQQRCSASNARYLRGPDIIMNAPVILLSRYSRSVLPRCQN